MLSGLLQPINGVLHRGEVHVRRNSFDGRRDIGPMRVGGCREGSLLYFLIALRDLLLLVFQQSLQVGFIFCDGFGLRGVIEREQVGISNAKNQTSGSLGENAFVREVGIGKMGIPIEVVVDGMVLGAFVLAAVTDIKGGDSGEVLKRRVVGAVTQFGYQKVTAPACFAALFCILCSDDGTKVGAFKDRHVFFGIADVAGNRSDHRLQVLSTSGKEISASATVGVDVNRGVLLQIGN